MIYDKGKHWEGRGYEPSPHVLFVGAPVGRSGPDGASVDGVIISHVYVGTEPSGLREPTVTRQLTGGSFGTRPPFALPVTRYLVPVTRSSPHPRSLFPVPDLHRTSSVA